MSWQGIRGRMRRAKEQLAERNDPVISAASAEINNNQAEGPVESKEDPRIQRIVVQILSVFKPPQRTTVLRLLTAENKSLSAFAKALLTHVDADAGLEWILGVKFAQWRLATNASFDDLAKKIWGEIEELTRSGEKDAPRVPEDRINSLGSLARQFFPPQEGRPKRR